MDLTQLANLGEFIGGVAVLATLIYLAVQVRQNTNAVLSSTQQGLHFGWGGTAAGLSHHPTEPLSQLVVKARRNYSDLNDEERVRFDHHAGATFGQWETTFYQYRRGVLEPELWSGWDAYFRDNVANEGYRHFWTARKAWYFREFQLHVDACAYGDSKS